MDYDRANVGIILSYPTHFQWFGVELDDCTKRISKKQENKYLRRFQTSKHVNTVPTVPENNRHRLRLSSNSRRTFKENRKK